MQETLSGTDNRDESLRRGIQRRYRALQVSPVGLRLVILCVLDELVGG